MKSSIPQTLILSGALILGLPILAQGSGNGQGNAGGQGNGNGSCSGGTLQSLTAEETRWLGFMREEERLARDIYKHLFGKWGFSLFENIADSEDRHFQSIGRLLLRYKMQDPSLNLPPGTYANPELTALFVELTAKGGRSLRDALEVGVLIEKTDISDLESALKSTTKPDLKRVWTNLMDASYQHQEAFESCLEINN